MRNSFIDTVVAGSRKRDDLIILSGDAGLGVFDDLRNACPGKFLNLGVAEQNMTGFAAGLAMAGFKVYLYNIIPFLLYRCYEQVRNDICCQELPVVLAGTGSGITYAPAGISHYAIEDIGLARTLPNLTVLSPADPVEARAAAIYSLKARNPVYVRIAKSGEPVLHPNNRIDISLPQIIRKGTDIAIVFHGSISGEVIRAYHELVKDGIQPMLLSVPMLQPLKIDLLLNLLEDKKYVLSVEEHFENSGLGSLLRGIYAEYSPAWNLRVMGIPYGLIHNVSDLKQLRKHFGISADHIIKTVKGLLDDIKEKR